MENTPGNAPAKEPTKKDLIEVLQKTGTIKKEEKWDNLTIDQLEHLIGVSEIDLTPEEKNQLKAEFIEKNKDQFKEEFLEGNKETFREEYLDTLGNSEQLLSEEIVKRRTSEQKLKQLQNVVKSKLEEFTTLLK